MMTLKLKTVSMLLAMAALSMTACKRETLSEGGEKNPEVGSGRYLYVNAAIALPTTADTRSSTDTSKPEKGDSNDQTNSDLDKDENGNKDDYEYGYDYENDVRTMLLVIADTEDKYISHTVVASITEAPTAGSKFDFVVNGEIKYEDLEKAYDDGGVLKTNQTVRVYAFCNYTSDLIEKFNAGVKDKTIYKSDQWINWTCKVTEPASPAGHTPAIDNTIWAKRSFLMSNSRVYEFEFPEDINAWDPYTDKNNPYKLTSNAVDDNQPDSYDDASLRPIKVERAAARIDFRDASDEGDQVYKLKVKAKKIVATEGEGVDDDDDDTENAGDFDEKNLFSVKLTRMALVNMSEEFYYLRRVTLSDVPTSFDGNAWYGVGRPETSKNYVVDVDWSAKKSKTITPENADKYFNFPLFTDEEKNENGNYVYNKDGWYADQITDVLKGEKDTWSGSTADKQYHIWRYVTENTIPGVDEQITVQSTGVVFKAAIIAGDDVDDESYVSPAVAEALAAAADGKSQDEYDYPILFSYNNLLYAGVDELIEEANGEGIGGVLYIAATNILENWHYNAVDNTFVYGEGASEKLSVEIYNDILRYRAYQAALEKEPKQDPEEEFKGATEYYKAKIDFSTGSKDEETFMKLAPAQGVTIYKASNEGDGNGWGYYCYYFYWNRHNDNLRSGKMGIMEFATVRNNVYKLAVTGIGRLGHPRITDYDPDPVDPEDPDEELLTYIQVQVEVLPWVVRVNDIEF